MKKLLSTILAFALCLSALAATGLIASADEEFDRLVNATGGNISFVNDAEHPWVQDTVSIGKYGVSAGNTGVDSSSSSVTATVTFTESQGIFFTWRVSSQQKWDYLAFSVDGVEKARISGTVGPENRAFAVEAGEHVVAWTYVKDEAYSLYEDKGYIDDVYVGSYSASAGNIDAALSTDSTLSFVNDPSEPWIQENVSGASAARSGNAGKSASESAVALNTALEAGKSLVFSWGVSSEKDHDLLIFEVNGEQVAAISGEVAYPTSYSYTAAASGDYSFRWIYRKDTLNDFGSDCGRLGNVRVADYVPATGIVTVKNTTVAVGKTLKLTYALRPTNATNKGVVWTSDAENVAAVDADGVVTGVSAGAANITATTVDGGFTAVSAVTVTAFGGDYAYYVNASSGNDRNNGKSASAAFRTLSKAYSTIYSSVSSGASVKLVLSGIFTVSEELRIFDKEVNLLSASTASIKRAGGYTGPLFRVSAGGRLRFGSTEASSSRVFAGLSSADAPCFLVDGGELILYPNAEITGNAGSVSGAGVYVKSGSFVMLGGSVADNTTSRYGGGVYAEDGSVVISGGSVSGNRASVYGGGAYVATGVERSIDEALFSGNSAESFNDICYGAPPAAPAVSGVEDGAEYSLEEHPEGVSASWNSEMEATATLNGEPYAAGTPITAEGEYVLTVTDGFSVVTVSFRLYVPTKDPVAATAYVSDSASGETGFISFDIYGGEPVARGDLERPVAAAEYVAGDTYGYSEDGYFFTFGGTYPASPDSVEWSAEPAITDYTALDMTYDYVSRNFIVLMADDDNKRFVGVVDTHDGKPREIVPLIADGGAEAMFITVACDMNGGFYAVSAGDNAALWAVTGVTEDGAVLSKLFDLGVEAYYLQSMTFDRSTGVLYWAQCGTEAGGIYEIDIAGESCALIGAPAGADAELTAFVVAYDVDTEARLVSEDGRFIYTLLPWGGAEIVGYNYKNGEGEDNFPKFDEDTYLVEVPAAVDGVEVLSIGKHAFRDNGLGEDPQYMPIGRVVLPESVETIGYGAFRGNVNMKEFEFGGQEHVIGDYAFYQCSALTDVNIPWPTETIGYGAFAECSALEKVTVTGPTEGFGDYIFYNVAEGFELWGHWPSATYDYATANGLTFRDIEPYEGPVVSGVEDGGRYALSDLPEGVAITWTALRVESATLDGEPYAEGTPITALGDHVFVITDGRTEVTVSFTVVEALYRKGDLDEDGEITVGDALKALRIAAKLVAPTDKDMLIGNVDGDGEITVGDALMILRVAAKLIDETAFV